MRTDEIRFLLNGERRSVANLPSTQTVLSYLREDQHLTGTKEGCAEGDCGACTVVVAEPDTNGRLKCRAINSCIQFLPTLDGKAIFTVESLKPHDVLHPVQQLMADMHGSQCGFCTPGFVMSLFALYKSQPAPDRATVEDALSGNLCRCTGYRPIIDAALAMKGSGAKVPADTQEWVHVQAGDTSAAALNRETELIDSLAGIQRSGALETRQDAGAFYAPATIQELGVLRGRLPAARLLAGGTDIGLWVTKQLRELPDIIYLGGIAELRTITVDSTHIDIGAGATLADVAPVLAMHYPELDTILRRFASPPIRNAATLGGNIANGSPIGDSMPCLIALGANVVLRSAAGTRAIPLEDFYLDYQKTALKADEFVERIRVPLPRLDMKFRAYKIAKRFDQDISLVLGAFSIRIENGALSECRVAFGGMAAIPKRAARCEAMLEGQEWNSTVIDRAADRLSDDFTPIDDMRGSARYRMLVAKNLLKKFFMEVSGGTSPTRVEQLFVENL